MVTEAPLPRSQEISILSQINPVHAPSTDFLKINFQEFLYVVSLPHVVLCPVKKRTPHN